MVGRFRAVAWLPIAVFAGLMAWLIWLAIHLYYLNGFENRVLISVRWTWSFFTRGRGSRLITGTHATHASMPPIGSLGNAGSLGELARMGDRSSA
jgi:hypothetical protein